MDIRATLLEVVRDFSDGRGSMQAGPILDEAQKRLSKQGSWDGEVLMTLWNDLFRQGLVGWGFNVSNPAPPWVHLSKRGRTALANLSRDPSNPDGYRANLAARTQLSPISSAYVAEALETYNASCYKAAAVMVGGAAESLALELRDLVVGRVSALGRPVPTDLNDWRIAVVLRSIERELDQHLKQMPRALRESYDSYWSAFTQQIRAVRNEAGHPSSVDPVTADAVHAALLVFPELAVLTKQLGEWATGQMP
jgi:hypothetical protein